MLLCLSRGIFSLRSIRERIFSCRLKRHHSEWSKPFRMMPLCLFSHNCIISYAEKDGTCKPLFNISKSLCSKQSHPFGAVALRKTDTRFSRF